MSQATLELSPAQLWRKAIIDILPLSLAVVPWGILVGTLAIDAGLSALQAQCLSLLVFAGAVQLASLTMLHGPLAPLLATATVISSRHLLYSAVMREDIRRLSFPWRVSLAFFLTDELFAVVMAFKQKYQRFDPSYALIAGFTFYLIWNLATLLGIVAGKLLPDLRELGFEFAIAATFIAIVIPAIKDIPALGATVASGVTVLLCHALGLEQALLIAAFIGMAVGFHLSSRRPPAATQQQDSQTQQEAKQ